MKLARTLVVATIAALSFSTTALAGDGMLGVYLTADDNTRDGALIEEVAPRSPAAEAGFNKGDRIISCNGKPTPNSSALIPFLADGNAGQTLTLRLSRDGWEKTFKVTLAPKKGASAPAQPAQPAGPKERGFLGVYLRQNDKGQPVIDGVMEGSPAAKGGLKVGDRVASVDRRPVEDPSTLITAISQFGVGESVVFGVERDGKEKTVTVVLGRRGAEHSAPPAQAEPSKPTPAPQPSAGAKPYIGVALVDNDGAGPLKVDEVQAGSPAEKFGLRAGDVILTANSKPLKTIEDFVSLMKQLHGGDVVELKIERDGWKSDVRLTLGSR